MMILLLITSKRAMFFAASRRTENVRGITLRSLKSSYIVISSPTPLHTLASKTTQRPQSGISEIEHLWNEARQDAGTKNQTKNLSEKG